MADPLDVEALAREELYAREIVDVLVDGLRHEAALPTHRRSAQRILARYRDEVRGDYFMLPRDEPGCCIRCSAKPAPVEIVQRERQMATYFCSLACAQSYDFAAEDAKRREAAQMDTSGDADEDGPPDTCSHGEPFSEGCPDCDEEDEA